jgi:hypothetical protein
MAARGNGGFRTRPAPSSVLWILKAVGGDFRPVTALTESRA